MWGWVRNLHPAEAPVNDGEVVIRIAPASQSAHGIRVLPERGFIEVPCVYVEVRCLNGKRERRKVNDRSSNPNMALRQCNHTCS
jgi:hypothetical protein